MVKVGWYDRRNRYLTRNVLEAIIAHESTYEVDWVPRPSARIAPDTEAVYEPYNGTYILPALCEGISGHVDFDLTGLFFRTCQSSQA
jgi:hypothetical protein